jgi:hypothetical protein
MGPSTRAHVQARATEENVEKMADYARRASRLWLEFAAAADAAVRGDEAAAVAEDLRRHDEALYGFARRDPDNAVGRSLSPPSCQARRGGFDSAHSERDATEEPWALHTPPNSPLSRTPCP